MFGIKYISKKKRKEKDQVNNVLTSSQLWNLSECLQKMARPSSLSQTRLSSLIFSELNVCKMIAKTPEFFLCSSASE